jgi:hypothetical protein
MVNRHKVYENRWSYISTLLIYGILKGIYEFDSDGILRIKENKNE